MQNEPCIVGTLAREYGDFHEAPNEEAKRQQDTGVNELYQNYLCMFTVRLALHGMSLVSQRQQAAVRA
jgi:hypothetical protein